jgi:integrase
MARKHDDGFELPVEPGRYRCGDRLWLQVRNAENRSWLYRYSFNGAQREMGLGPTNRVTAFQANAAIEHWRKILLDGLDPIEERARTKAATKAKKSQAQSFQAVAETYMASHSAGWTNDKHRRQWPSTLATYVYPTCGAKPVNEIEQSEVYDVLLPIWDTKRVTAKRVRSRIEMVLRFAASRGWRTGDNPVRWRDGLDQLLPKSPKIRKHFAALPWEDVPAFMVHLRLREGASARALELTILTASRSGPVQNAKWREFDLAERMWRCPAENMKGKEAFDVPLSDAAVDLLQTWTKGGADPENFVFPGKKMLRPLSNMTLTVLIRKMNESPQRSSRPYLTAKLRKSLFRMDSEVLSPTGVATRPRSRRTLPRRASRMLSAARHERRTDAATPSGSAVLR